MKIWEKLSLRLIHSCTDCFNQRGFCLTQDYTDLDDFPDFYF